MESIDSIKHGNHRSHSNYVKYNFCKIMESVDFIKYNIP